MTRSIGALSAESARSGRNSAVQCTIRAPAARPAVTTRAAWSITWPSATAAANAAMTARSPTTPRWSSIVTTAVCAGSRSSRRSRGTPGPYLPGPVPAPEGPLGAGDAPDLAPPDRRGPEPGVEVVGVDEATDRGPDGRDREAGRGARVGPVTERADQLLRRERDVAHEAPPVVVGGVEALQTRRGGGVGDAQHRGQHGSPAEAVGALLVLDLHRSRDLAEGDRALRDADRLVRAPFEQDVVPRSDPRQQLGILDHVHEGPRQRRVQVRLGAEVQHDDVAGRADELVGWRQVGVRVHELLEEVAPGDPGGLTGGPDLGDDRLDVVHGAALAGPARRPC